MKEEKKEEKAIILDFLPHGYAMEGKMIPVAQALGIQYLTLLQLVPRKGITLEQGEEVYIGEGKRDKISYIFGRLPREKLTEAAKLKLAEFVSIYVEKNEKLFIEFFNKAEPVNTRIHQLELLPGFGKKHTALFLEEREKKTFSSFEEIKKRIAHVDAKKAIEKRIMQELEERTKHKLFTA